MDFDPLESKEKDKHSTEEKELTQLSGNCSGDLQDKDPSKQIPILIKEQPDKKKLAGEGEHERLNKANMEDDAFNEANDNRNNKLGGNRVFNQNKMHEPDSHFRINKMQTVIAGMALLLIY